MLGIVSARLLLAPDDPSPAGGHAEVIAHGVAPMPADAVAWRVVRDTAELIDDAPVQDRALGFVHATDGAIVETDEATGAQVRLAADEAAFVPNGARTQRASLGDGPVGYDRIGLVPADAAADAGGDTLVFAGDAFDAPSGNRDLDLVRDVLAPDEATDLPDTGFPTLVLATAGQIEVDVDGEEQVALSAGDAATFAGDLTIRATGSEEATFVAALIGPEVPAPLSPTATPTQTPTPTPAPGGDEASVAIQMTACPAEYAGDDFAADCTEPVAGVTVRLLLIGSEFGLEETTSASGKIYFANLGEGTYAFAGGVPGEFADQAVFCADIDGNPIPIPTEPEPSGVPDMVAQFVVGQGEQVVCSWYVIPFDLQGETGTISLTVQLCPAADTPVEECQFLTELDGAITISGPVELSTDDALNHDVSWYWGEDFGLPFGLYALNISELTPPDGYTLDRVDGTFGGSEIGWTFELTAGQPNAILNVVFVPIPDDTGDEASTGS